MKLHRQMQRLDNKSSFSISTAEISNDVSQFLNTETESYITSQNSLNSLKDYVNYVNPLMNKIKTYKLNKYN